jgi:ribosomal-protein-alanine N-acetyltransferase
VKTRLHNELVLLREWKRGDERALLELRKRNRDFLAPFEPIRDESWFTLGGQRAAIAYDRARWEQDEAYLFGIFERPSETLAGWIAIANISRGAWQNATLGYAVDERLNGRGLATAAIGLALQFAFAEAGLHRVQAAVLPHNARSARVLEKNGFRREGHARRYLQIAGRWEDHDMFAITAEEFEAR